MSPRTDNPDTEYGMETDGRSLPDLVRNLRDDTIELLRQEMNLAVTELNEKAAHVSRNAGYLGAGGAVLWSALVVLLACACVLVGMLLDNFFNLELRHVLWLSPLIVGVITALIGWGMLNKGKKALKAENLKPQRTIRSLQEDKQWAQDRMQ